MDNLKLVMVRYNGMEYDVCSTCGSMLGLVEGGTLENIYKSLGELRELDYEKPENLVIKGNCGKYHSSSCEYEIDAYELDYSIETIREQVEEKEVRLLRDIGILNKNLGKIFSKYLIEIQEHKKIIDGELKEESDQLSEPNQSS
jgi:hypothetical protein